MDISSLPQMMENDFFRGLELLTDSVGQGL